MDVIKLTPTTFSRQQKIIVFSVSVGLAILGLVARYVRQKSAGRQQMKNLVGGGRSITSKNQSNKYGTESSSAGSIIYSPSRNRTHIRTSSVASSALTNSTLVSNSVFPENQDYPLNCTQLGIMGVESLEKAIHFWEESLNLLKTSEDPIPEEERETNERTIKHLEKILNAAKQLEMLTEEFYLHENSVLYELSERGSSHRRLKSVSSIESFASAEDFLSDDEEITMSLLNFDITGEKSIKGDDIYPLYEAALRLVEAGAVPYRSLKTEMVGCLYGDNEYLAKLHCLRGAFSRIISNHEKRDWIASHGKEVLVEIIIKADKDPKEFESSFDDIVAWSQEANNWGLIETELKDRGLRALTFYDIVLDFIFLDAFEDLEAPPASVLAVVANRWLSNSFKETALGTAVWSVLKTKRRWLRYQNGFVAHFYDLSEHIMPTLAWGFLGPPSELNELCNFFKEKFLEFLKAIFSFDQVRYSTLDELAFDIFLRMEDMHKIVMDKLENSRISF